MGKESLEQEGRTVGGKGSRHRHLMPVAVLVLGLSSMALLVWTDQISQRQRMHFSITNALADLRTMLATSYLWLEEVIAGEERDKIEKTWSDLREATRLSEALLNGGVSDDGLALQRLQDPELRRRAEDIGLLVSEYGMLARERYQRYERSEAVGAGSDIEDRIDGRFDEFQRAAEEFEGIVKETQATDYANSRRLLLGILLAWSSIVSSSTVGLWLLDRRRRRAEAELQRAKDDLELRVAERTGELRSLNDELRVELIERKKMEEALRESEDQLRHLSFKLLTAQETERTRIATELHDGLGHSLVLTKLRLGVIEKALREDQPGAKEDCKDLSQFIDEIVEDVRRLSRDLRPSVLEDLGLSGAVRWLVGRCVKNGQPEVVSSTIDIDHLVPYDQQIVLYRIIQEALTNAVKHAQAKQISLSIAREGDRIAIVVEDDGEGFDVAEAVMRDTSQRGFGLATMHERARMLGGSLGIWSREGKGTRISLGIPVPNGGSTS